jgi:hypothetical protein
MTEKSSKTPYPPGFFSWAVPCVVLGVLLVLGLAAVFALDCMLFLH